MLPNPTVNENTDKPRINGNQRQNEYSLMMIGKKGQNFIPRKSDLVEIRLSFDALHF